MLCVAPPLPLELALELAALALALVPELLLALALALALAAELDTVTTPVGDARLTVLNSVGIETLNSPVIGTSGARSVVAGVLDPTTLVSGCCELGSRLSVDTSTLNGSPHEEVELWALPSPKRESSAELRKMERRILVNWEEVAVVGG